MVLLWSFNNYFLSPFRSYLKINISAPDGVVKRLKMSTYYITVFLRRYIGISGFLERRLGTKPANHLFNLLNGFGLGHIPFVDNKDAG
jgi:hypothetical protein